MEKMWLDFVGVMLAGLAAFIGTQNNLILSDIIKRIERLENHFLGDALAENEEHLGGKKYAKQ